MLKCDVCSKILTAKDISDVLPTDEILACGKHRKKGARYSRDFVALVIETESSIKNGDREALRENKKMWI